METKQEETNPAEVKAEVAAKAETAETKPSKSNMKPVIAAMRKLGDLAMSDVATLEKALREAEAKGQTARAELSHWQHSTGAPHHTPRGDTTIDLEI